MKKSNNPCLTNTEALKEVANRTGLPINAVLQAICSYHDIVRECINNGVEVQMGELGTMRWRSKPPRYGVVYYDFKTKENLPPQDTPGFNYPYFVAKQTWKRELKELTKFWENEGKEESEDGV